MFIFFDVMFYNFYLFSYKTTFTSKSSIEDVIGRGAYGLSATFGSIAMFIFGLINKYFLLGLSFHYPWLFGGVIFFILLIRYDFTEISYEIINNKPCLFNNILSKIITIVCFIFSVSVFFLGNLWIPS